MPIHPVHTTDSAADSVPAYCADHSGKSWIEEEMEGCEFRDERLARRARIIIERLAGRIGGSIPAACRDWAATKAAYRFFSNESVSEADILGGHFAATRERIAAHDGPVLILHDTTEFIYKREADASGPGLLHRYPKGRDAHGKLREVTVRGILMHSSLVLTPEGLPLGLAAVKFWTREKFKGCNALKKKINPTRVPIEEKESHRWLENLRQSSTLAAAPGDCVHIGDRESDIFELFCAVEEIGTRFLVRTCVDRLSGDGTHTVAAGMVEASVRGLHRIRFVDRKGTQHEAVLELKYRQMEILPPAAKQKRCPVLRLTVIHATERGTPQGREPIQWKLLTNLPVHTRAEAIEKLDWYALRWKIETFHKILKSGCKAEESKLRSTERLASFIAVCCIVSWRVFWLTMLRRIAPDAPAEVALTETEIQILDALTKPPPAATPGQKDLTHYLLILAKLGGYLARANDPPPGNLVMWRGITRLTEIHLGFLLASKLVGN
jgi:Transposase DNA-binding